MIGVIAESVPNRTLRVQALEPAWISLVRERLIREALDRELQAYRASEKAAAMRRVAELAYEQGDVSAAWAKVNLSASQLLLGDAVGAPQAKASHIEINTGPQLRAGIVIKLPSDIAEKLEHNRAVLYAKSID